MKLTKNDLLRLKKGNHTRRDISGMRFGKMVAIERYEKQGSRWLWLCKCDCGKEKPSLISHLLNGSTISCGCKKGKNRVTHGQSATGKRTKVYGTWSSMKYRCSNPKDKFYKSYGGRGIKVCDEWKNDFLSFYNYIGEPPSKIHQIDRIDNDGNYEPGNVRWALPVENACNKRTNIKLIYNNEPMTLKEYSMAINVNYSTLYNQYRKGILDLKVR